MTNYAENLEFHTIDLDSDSGGNEPLESEATEDVAALLRADSWLTLSPHAAIFLSEDEGTPPSPALSAHNMHQQKSIAVHKNILNGRLSSDRSSHPSNITSMDKTNISGADAIEKPTRPRLNFIKSLSPFTAIESAMEFLKTFNSEESPKQVCGSEASSALKHYFLFHLPAIAITLSLLILYAMHFRWSYLHPNPDELSALQFAAKVHEAFIIISLMDIIDHRVAYGLLYDKGISLGFVASPYSLGGSSIQYLTSWEFWAAFLYPTSNHNFNRTTGVLIIIIGLLGISAGPFSATVMIPRQRWWGLSKNYTEYLNDLAGIDILNGNSYRREPTYFKSVPWCEVDSMDDCEGLKLDAKVDTITTIIEDPPILPYFQNITYGNYDNPNNRQITFSKASNMSLTLSSCPMSFIADVFDNKYQRTQGTKLNKLLMKSQQKNGSEILKWKQPLLSVHCDSYTSSGENPTFNFDGGFYEKYETTITLKKYMGLFWNFTEYNELKDFPKSPDPVFLDLRHEVDIPMSTAILFGGAVNRDMKTSSHDEFGNMLRLKLDLCLIHVRWAEVDLWQDYTSSNILNSGFEFASEDTLEYLRSTSTPDNIIRLTTEYLGEIGRQDNTTAFQDKFRNPVYRGLESHCMKMGSVGPKWDALTLDCLTINLALYLTNSLSQSASKQGEEETLFQNTYYEYLYGYDFQDSISLRLAFAALLLHVCISLIHLGTIIFSETPWHSFSWGSFGQILVLALRSRSGFGLKNVGSGVASSRTWPKTVFVGEIKDKRTLEMAIANGDGSYRNKRHMLLRAKAGLNYS